MVERALTATWRLRTAQWHAREEGPSTSAAPHEVAPGPVVVGGLGGSGTRVVEEMLRRLSVYTGSDLNSAGDNRWFTFLCKLPRWDLSDSDPGSEVARSLATLERAMTSRLDIAGRDGTIVQNALRRNRHWWRRDRLRDDRPPAWLRERVATLLRSVEDQPVPASLWGWKEPNSHLLIRHLHLYFGDRLHYVHVIRNGLDMAQSTNQLQLHRWGPLFGVRGGAAPHNSIASLDYWIRANETAVEAGKRLRPGTFLLLNYDSMCANPEPEVARLAEFLGLDPSAQTRQELARLPRTTVSTARVECDVAQMFGSERLARVEALGFPIWSAQ